MGYRATFDSFITAAYSFHCFRDESHITPSKLLTFFTSLIMSNTQHHKVSILLSFPLDVGLPHLLLSLHSVHEHDR